MGWTRQGINRLNLFIERKRNGMKDAVKYAGYDTYDLIQRMTPEKTGKLKENITIDIVEDTDNTIDVGIGQISRLNREVIGRWYAETAGEMRVAEYPYWLIVEFGVFKIPHEIATRSDETIGSGRKYGLKLPPVYPRKVLWGYKTGGGKLRPPGFGMFRLSYENMKILYPLIMYAFIKEM